MAAFSFENQGAETILLCRLEKEEHIDNMARRMLENNNIKGIFKPNLIQRDEEISFKFQVTSKIPVHELYGSEMKRADVLRILSGIAATLRDAKGYMLEEDHFVLDAWHIYIDAESHESSLLYLPVAEYKCDHNLRQFVLEFLTSICYDMGEDVRFVAAIISFINRARYLPAKALYTELQRIGEDTAPEARQAAQAAQAPAVQIPATQAPAAQALEMQAPGEAYASSPLGETVPAGMADTYAASPFGETVPAAWDDSERPTVYVPDNESTPFPAAAAGSALPQGAGQPPYGQQGAFQGEPGAAPGLPGQAQEFPPYAQNPGNAYQQAAWQTQKKPGFFERLFGKKKKPDPMPSSQNPYGSPNGPGIYGGGMPPYGNPNEMNPYNNGGNIPNAYGGANGPDAYGAPMPYGPTVPYNEQNLYGSGDGQDIYGSGMAPAPYGNPNEPNPYGGAGNPYGNPDAYGNAGPSAYGNPGYYDPATPYGGQTPYGNADAQGGSGYAQAFPADGEGRSIYLGGGSNEEDEDNKTVIVGGGMEEDVPQAFMQDSGSDAAFSLRMATISRKRNGQSMMVNKALFRIGSSASMVDFYIGDNPSVGPLHADIVQMENGDYELADQNTPEHSFVNGEMLPAGSRKKLQSGDVIRLGDEEFVFTVR